MEKLTKEVLEVMSKDELKEAVETLQLKLDVAEKEIESLKSLADIGKKYMEHLKAEALRLIKAVDGENTPLLKLIDKADVDTLKAIVEEYEQKGKEKFRAVSRKDYTETEDLTVETLMKADYDTLLKLKEKFMEVK